MHDVNRGGRVTGRPSFVGLLLLGLLLWPACGFAARPVKVVLVTVDGLPADLGAGSSGMPATQGLVMRGQRATLDPGELLPYPAACELLTGRPASRSGVVSESGPGLEGRDPTLAEVLGTRGVRSLALPADPFTHAGTGLARGFDHWVSLSPALPDSARVDSALAWLALPGERFVWLAFTLGEPAEAWRRVDGAGLRDPDAAKLRQLSVDDAIGRLALGCERMERAQSVLLALTGAAAPRGGGVGPVVIVADGIAPTPRAAQAPADRSDIPATLAGAMVGTRGPFPGRDLLAGAPAARPVPAPHPPDEAALEAQRCRLAARELGAIPAPDSTLLVRFDSLASACGGNRDAVLERAWALSRAGREFDAARAYKEWIAANPAVDEARLAYAQHLLLYRRFDVIEDVLVAVDPTSPAAALAQWGIAFARMGQGEFLGALGTSERATRLAVSTAYERELPAALRELLRLQSAIEHDGKDAPLRYEYAARLGELGLVDLASGQLQTAQSIEPASAEPDYRLALLLLQQGRPQHAIPTLKRALERDSTYHPAQLLLADAYLQHGERHEARLALEAAERTGPLEARDHYNLACLLATEGETTGAWVALERAVAAGYGDVPALEHDPDLTALRGDPRFGALLARARGR